MVLPGHLAGGYLVTKALLTIVDPTLSLTEIYFVYAIGIVTSELPDIDIAILIVQQFFNKKINKESHRDYITHLPIFWIIIGSVIALIGLILNKTVIQVSGLVLIGGTLTHFFLDSFEYGVRWFWPFSKKRFYLYENVKYNTNKPVGSIPYYLEFMRGAYLKTWTFYAEILIVIVAIVVFISGL